MDAKKKNYYTIVCNLIALLEIDLLTQQQQQ